MLDCESAVVCSVTGPHGPLVGFPERSALREEYLKPLSVGQREAPTQLGVSLNRLNEIVLGKRHQCEYGAAARTVPEDTDTVKKSGRSQLVPAALCWAVAYKERL